MFKKTVIARGRIPVANSSSQYELNARYSGESIIEVVQYSGTPPIVTSRNWKNIGTFSTTDDMTTNKMHTVDD